MTASSRHRVLLLILLLFLGSDLLLSAYHYYNLPFDGDLTKIGGPFRWYEEVMKDPFGIAAVTEGTKYSGAGRYMCHAWTVFWCNEVFPLIRAAVGDPVVAIYLLSSGIAMLVHLFFLLMAWLYVRVTESINGLYTLFTLCFATVFIQYGSFYHSIGIIDRSPSYIFFYALQLLFFSLYLLPFYRAYQRQTLRFSVLQHVLLALGAVYLAFSSVLTQPVYFVMLFLAGAAFLLSPRNDRWRRFLLHRHILPHLLWMLLLCAYAFYVSKFNNENTLHTTIWERYRLLAKGVYYLFTYDRALPWMSALTVLNFALIHRFAEPLHQKRLKGLFLAVLAFGVVYTGLLPLGGYRSYRPYIVRYDTFMPVTLAWIMALSVSTLHLLHMLPQVRVKKYLVAVLVFMGIFSWYDRDLEKDANACQQEVLYYLHRQTDTLIEMPRHCNVGTWYTTDYDDQTIMDVLNKLYRKWGIIQQDQMLYVRKDSPPKN